LEEQIRRYSTEQSALEEQIRDLMLKIKQDHDQHVLILNTSKLDSINVLRKLLGDLYHGLKLQNTCILFISLILVECALKADNYLEKIVSDLSKPPLVAPTLQGNAFI